MTRAILARCRFRAQGVPQGEVSAAAALEPRGRDGEASHHHRPAGHGQHLRAPQVDAPAGRARGCGEAKGPAGPSNLNPATKTAGDQRVLLKEQKM